MVINGVLWWRLHKNTKVLLLGDCENVSERQLEFISEIFKNLGFKTERQVKIENVGKPGDNYVALIKRIIIEDEGNILKIIAKVAPNNENLRAAMNTQMLFHNEHVMYTEILPKYTELEKTADVPEGERLKYAHCYGSLDEPPNEIILLEDLNESDYYMKDKFISLSDAAIRLVLKNFAKLHSLSYALKNKEHEIYMELSNKLKDMFAEFHNIPDIKIWMESLENDVIDTLEDDNRKKAVKGTVSQLSAYAMKNKAIDAKSRFSVILQGDSWTNNIMFKLKDNEAVDCCMIDYQLSRLSSPAVDLHYMIFNCTDFETRSKNYYDWLDYYHDQLDKHLSNFGLKANSLYPRDQLDAELRRCGKMAFGLTTICATAILRESSEAAEMKELMEKSLEKNGQIEDAIEKNKISATSPETVLRFRKRMEGLVDSFLEYGYL